MTNPSALRVLVLWDAENVSTANGQKAVSLAKGLGTLVGAHAFCSTKWRGIQSLASACRDMGVSLHKMPSYGPDSADVGMIAAAGFLIAEHDIDIVALVSDDGIFGHLAALLRTTKARKVVAIGSEFMPQSLIANCDVCVRFRGDTVDVQKGGEHRVGGADAVLQAVRRIVSRVGEPVPLSTVGHHLHTAGFKIPGKLSKLVRKDPGIRVHGSGPGVRISLDPGAALSA